VFLATVGLATVLLVGIQVATAAAAGFSWSPATEVAVTPPPNAGGEPNVLFDWGACPTAESCVAVGSYKDESGNRQALAALRTSGSWGHAVEIALPPGAAASAQNAGFSPGNPTVACTGRDACAAVGHYTEEEVGEAPMVAEETDGSWDRAREVEPPANAESGPRARLFSIACPASGSCASGGEYHSEGDREAMVAEETDGSWGQAAEIEPPANAASDPMASLSQAACSASGSCVAVGSYLDSVTGTIEAMVATEVEGTWGQASQVELPPNAASTPRSVLHSVVCVTSGPCVAVGKYTDGSGNEEAMAAEETDGSWGQATEIEPPVNAAGNPQATLNPGCPTSGSCVLVGAYTDDGGEREAMVDEQTDGAWGRAGEIASPANAAADPKALVGEVLCPASGLCLGFGEYENSGGSTGNMEVLGMTAPENTLAPRVSGIAEVGGALACSQGTWTASPTSFTYRWLRDGAAIGDAGSSAYTVAAADEGHDISCEVTATNAVGSRSVESSNSLSVPKKPTLPAPSPAPAMGSISLLRSVIRLHGGRGSVRLLCAGTATCTGTLRLTVARKAEKRKKAKVMTIATVAFSAAPGQVTAVLLRLTAGGRALLKEEHGKLRARLVIFKSFPRPTTTQRKSVRLI
jgi:hypothetical protein